jgi:hypothetical protein
MITCPFERVCTFANSERPDSDDLILREVFCGVHPNACIIFKGILEDRELPSGIRPHGAIRGRTVVLEPHG